MAIEQPLIRASAVEVSTYPDLIRAYRVNGVPKTVGDNGIEILGGLPEAEFISQALAAPLR